MFSQKELAPPEDQNFVFGIAQTAANATIDQAKLFAKEVEKIYESVPEKKATFQIILPSGGFGGMVVKPHNQRKRGVQEIVADLQQKTSHIPGIRSIQLVPPSLPGGEGFPVDFAIVSTAEPAQLADFANQIVQRGTRSGRSSSTDTIRRCNRRRTPAVFN